jgi:hypothetical protein
VERLETRDCPAAPVITTFSAVPLNSGRQVDLSGTVMDKNPSGVCITFSGVALGKTTTDATGHFDLVTQASSLGTVSAVGRDQKNLCSPTATATFTSAAPSLTLSIAYGSGRTVTLSGKVTDAAAGGLTVSFTGQVSGSATTNADGTYSFTAQAAALGTVQASTADAWGQASNTAQVTLASATPRITLSISYGSQRTVTLSGKVTAPSPGGLTVTFTGEVNGSVTTNADGTFSLTTQADGLGTIHASTTDAWGQASNCSQVTVKSNKPVINDFQAVEGSNGTWTFSGQVTDESAPGLMVTLSGLPSLTGKTVTVDSTGCFDLTLQLQPGENGTATAQTIDWWGLTSDAVTEWVSQTP